MKLQMTKIPIYIKKGMNSGKQVGYLDTETKTYHKVINYKSNQMMQHPKHIGRIGVSKSVLAQLQGYKCEKINILVSGFEKKSFEIIITLNDFINNSKEENWDDVQLFCSMNKFERKYHDQEELVNVH